MRDRGAEFESLGAEAMPANFSYFDRVVRMGLEDVPVHQQPRRQFQPLGLVPIVARWLEERANH
jgi:hypothetical protein